MRQVGILLTARLGSTRLRRKHLLEINNKPILKTLIERIKNEFANEIKLGRVKIIIATSDEIENRDFQIFFEKTCDVFYGSKENIPLRHLEAARKYELDAIVSIDGDDILCSTEAMQSVYKRLALGKNFVKTQGLPLGMNVMGYSTEFLKASLKKHECDTLETGWGRIFNQTDLEIIDIHLVEENNRLRFTLDYETDYQFFKQVIVDLADVIYYCSTKSIIEHVLKHRLYEITDTVNEEYWMNFNTQVQEEKKKEETR